MQPASPYTFTPTRRTQPYRQGQQSPSPALAAMQRGRTLYGQNPMDVQRNSQASPGSLLWLLLESVVG